MNKNRSLPGWAVLLLKLLFFAVIIGFVSFTVRSYGEKKEAEMEARLREQNRPEAEEVSQEPGIKTWNGKTYRQDPINKIILWMGVDTSGAVEEKRVSGSGGQADAIGLLIQNKATDEVRLLSIPRDTMTEIKLFDLVGNELGTDVQHLNLAYAYGNGEKESCELLQEAVEQLLGGISIDGYLSVNMSAISQLNDMVGGVTVRIDDPGMENRDPSLVYGSTVTLQGSQAETYVRYRDTDVSQSALGRMDRHKNYASAWMSQASAMQKKDSQFLGAAFEAVQDYMVTNLNKDEYLDAGLAAMQTEHLFDGDHFFTVPGTGTEGLVYDEFYPDEAALEELIINLFYKEI